MTYVDPAARARAHQSVAAPLRGGGNADEAATYRLPVKGQGTIGFALKDSAPFTVAARGGDGSPALRWTVGSYEVILELVSIEGEVTELLKEPGIGLDASLACPYWFSFDCHNRLLRYGKGEMRLGTMLASRALERPKDDQPDPWTWISDIEEVEVSAAVAGGFVDIWKDPVTIELPMRVVPHDMTTMEDIAYGRVTVPASLTATCQKLYDNVAGARFILDTPDFPDFSAAIKASILDTGNGWCAKKLEEKAHEFGKYNPEMTYLRITLGTNQGESPGIPFVMEIWPSGNYSPVHNHGGSDAVIRVLHGEINVSLYPFLAERQTPFAAKTFVKEDVTWISARLNQVHQLRNLNMDEPCITIQCYLYSDDNRTHWPYFDYLGDNRIEHFDPNSDADFLSFKELMKKEWAGR